ncbi:MAG TPA: hypothetical protein DEO70_14855 [Bacteroidales bacterium]|nr:MAG: hypothetical protein A2X11_09675 [Bacteroidetes bacterium GWE2_42_24]HBZ68111.1 hypothetical protein [Bacteroidales bacterium]
MRTVMWHFKNDETTDVSMKKRLIFLLTVVLSTISTYGQSVSGIIIPTFNDTYCKYISQLESGQTDINYQDFRFSFIESEQFKIAGKKSSELDSLRDEMYLQMDKSNYQEIIKITEQMLSIDYTNMTAQKIMRQTYKIVGDTINAAKYKAIQFGLLKSIVDNGDGQSCETAWPVIQISEEYYILDMIDAKLVEQSIVNDGNLCDKMVVTIDGEEKIYYFEISKVFEGREK